MKRSNNVPVRKERSNMKFVIQTLFKRFSELSLSTQCNTNVFTTLHSLSTLTVFQFENLVALFTI